MDHRIKILHVLYAGLGGHGNVFFSLVEADHDKCYEHEALFNGVENMRPEYISRCRNLNIPFSYVPKKPGFDLNYYRILFRLINRSNAGVIFLHSSAYILPAKIVKWFGKKKCVIVVRETQANHLKSKAEWFWLKVAMKLADKIVFLSEDYRQEIRDMLPRYFKQHKTAVIPNGIDLSKFRPVVKTQSGNLLAGMQSRLVEIKDHRTLIASVVRYNRTHAEEPLRLLIAGDGASRPALETLVSSGDYSSHITFTGMLNESELLKFIHSLDIYIHASFGETMSTAIMQAMACGLPIIASNVAGINNMITDDETGILVKLEDVDSMTNAISNLTYSSEERERLGSAALKYAKHNFSNEIMFKRYAEIFEELMKLNK